MRMWWELQARRVCLDGVPLSESSFRLLAAGAVGVLIWVIWLTGMVGDSQRVTMLALSGVSILGLGLVIELGYLCRAEEKARESETRYRLLADHSFDMIVRFDPLTQTRTYVSPACRRLYGYEPDEALALSAEEIIHPDDLAAVRDALTRLEDGADHTPILYRGRRRDGSYVWVEASLTRVRDRETGAVEIVSVVRDASERMRYEAALREAKEEADTANRSKSKFLATMSHELRTPLNAVIGFAEIMQQEVMGPIGNPQYRAYVTDIHVSGMHLLQLINDILDLTKAEAGKLELQEQTVDLEEAVRAVAQVSRASIDKAGLTLDIDMPGGGLPPLCADERKMRQVFFNLVGNAVKFTPPGGYIRVTGRFDPRRGFRVVVADTGIGIPAADLERVMQPFVQLDSSHGRQYPGTGLGLPTAKAIIELHGGRLILGSTVGGGTEATATFPVERAILDEIPRATQSAA